MAIFPEIEKFIYYNLFICKRKVRNRYILFSQGRLKSGFPESASSNALSASLLSKTFPPIRSNPTLVAEIRPYIFKKEN